ncbi:MAG: CHAT domain-containing protein [Bacteroidales bacterium]|nr:CHAT domain-containing protein [Bacteroidales bacterium]
MKSFFFTILFGLFSVCASQAQSILEKSWSFEESIMFLANSNEDILFARNIDDSLNYYEHLAMSYVGVGDFANAVKTLEKALDIYEDTFGLESLEYGYGANLMAWIYFSHGYYAEALDYYIAATRACRISDNFSGMKTNFESAIKMYLLLAQYDYAEEFLTDLNETYDIYPQLKETPDYIMHLHSWAKLYESTGRDDLAFPLYVGFVNYFLTNKSSEMFMVFASLLGDVANFFFKIKQYELAEISFDILHKAREGVSENDRDKYLSIARDYFRKQGDEMTDEQLLELISGLPENNRYGAATDYLFLARYYYWKKDDEKTDKLLPKTNRYYADLMKNNALYIHETAREDFWTSLEFNYNFFYSAARNSSSPELWSLCYNNHLKLKSVLLNTGIEERETLRKVPVTKKRNITWKDIQGSLKANEAAIEFITFDDNDGLENSGHRYSMALLIKKSAAYPEMIKLFEQKELELIVQQYKKIESFNVNGLYKDPRLYDLIWKPLAKLLEQDDISKVYFSVSGDLNTVAFHALRGESGYLGQKYYLYQLSSTGKLVSENLDDRINRTSAVIYGDIDYGKGEYENLELGKQKIEEIGSLCKTMGIPVTFFTGKNATNDSFTKMSNAAPGNLFIITHGFYDLPDERQKHPLLRTGLLLSDANDPAKNGRIFAEEIAGMNLFGLDLVVLSACITGLGDIHNYEGVFGLQRAFKLAGAKSIIMSLWNIPNEKTAIFTRIFLEQLERNKSKREAFREAQRRLMQAPHAEVEDWAGLILLD